MNSPRVNLLDKSECRHQGPVSRQFALVSAIVTPILLIAVLAAVKMIQLDSIKNELESKQAEWKRFQPSLVEFDEKAKGLDENRRLLELFEAWEKSRLPMTDLLNEIRDIVPERVELKQLSLGVNLGRTTRAVYKKPEDMVLKNRLQMGGLILEEKEKASECMTGFLEDLQGNDVLGGPFSDIGQNGPLVTRASAGGSSSSEFKIQGSAK
jgi:Tfp pilus assembly protein PilN